jgi:hypothetical protein
MMKITVPANYSDKNEMSSTQQWAKEEKQGVT